MLRALFLLKCEKEEEKRHKQEFYREWNEFKVESPWFLF